MRRESERVREGNRMDAAMRHLRMISSYRGATPTERKWEGCALFLPVDSAPCRVR